MKKYTLIFLFIFTATEASISLKENIIESLNDINNITFNFEQNINNKIENGTCTIQYPKKIFCKYAKGNQKILVSNGKSVVIKTTSSYYLYPLDRTPLNFILNKKFLINKIKSLNERIVDNKFVNYSFAVDENEINIYFDKNTYNLIGWQVLDIYQNLSITYLNSIIKNRKLKKKLFELPEQN